jgi:uncharacterized protein
MSDSTKFIAAVNAGYLFKGQTITLGGGMLDAAVVPNLPIRIPLSTMNRHGLIAGATGTGKTKTLQKITEQLSLNGVPCLVMDIKGDLSGISQPGVTSPRIEDRQKAIGQTWSPQQLPIEFLSISQQPGTRIRATVLEFGPVLFSKILELNDTQGGVVSIIFKYCDDNKLPLLDLADFKRVLQYLTGEGKDEATRLYGQISQASVGTIQRKIIELETQGANDIFGEPSFDVNDLIRCDSNGRGYISVLRLTDMQTKPKLFSTFMLSLMAEIYATFPEMGDVAKPKFCLFIDEAHLIFDQATNALLNQLEQTIKLIRSKGVGIYFITQNPVDVPAPILSQLGLKVQHALRAFTAADNKSIKMTANNYPTTEFYETEKVLTSLGIGEALVTCLDERGNPTPLVQVMMSSPETRMDIVTDQELAQTVAGSMIAGRYNQVIDRESALELLNARIAAQPVQPSKGVQNQPAQGQNEQQGGGIFDTISEVTGSRLGKQVTGQITRNITSALTRGLLGALGLGGRGGSKGGW